MTSTREVVEGFTDEQIDTLLSQLDPLITVNYLGRLTEDCYELTAFLPSESAGVETANAWRQVPYLIRQLRAALAQREAAVRVEERERCAGIAESGQYVRMVGGSTGDAWGTAKAIAAVIRNLYRRRRTHEKRFT